MDYNFEKNTRHELLSGYDYDSLMHYGPYAFSSNGKKTIVPIQNPSAVIGQRDNLSAKDIAELNALYDCQSNSFFMIYLFPFFVSQSFFLLPWPMIGYW